MHRPYNSFSQVDGGSAPSKAAIKRQEEPLEQSKALVSAQKDHLQYRFV